MERYALAFTVKPGSEEEVAKILASYGRPTWVIDENSRLLSTTIFMLKNLVVRVLDVEGDLPTVMRHLASQPEIRAVEEQLTAYLEEPRDMSTPQGAAAFFSRAIMKRVTHRVAGS